ncbi:MAG: ribonuclease P protein component [Lentisphaeria bacterium]|nr:ribonuclease P protein component [Lentisphaeria bacterium]MBO5765753.1 ribonuclease P protein component [Lentisphaeria bacterium]MBO5991642.1 ribonuclease P protein component [Lentisphaeria bacterium]
MHFTLCKKDKLRLKAQFDDVRQRGVRQAGPAVVAAVAPFEQLQCGVVCGRKFDLLAVKRNRARRLLWESFRLLKPYIKPCRIVLIPRRRILKYSAQRTMQELAGLLAQHGVLREDADIPQLKS